MRLRIVLGGTGEIFLPWEYPHLLHGLLYRAVIGENPEFGVFLHERGFGEDHHRYRLFVFSRIFPKKARRCEKGLWCTPPLVFWVASPLAFFLEALASALLRSRRISLGNTVLFVKSIEIEPPPDFSGKVLCETLSPLVASTGVRRGEKLHKVFLAPEDPRFFAVVQENLYRKARALGLSLAPDAQVFFEPVGTWRSKLVSVQGTNIRGYEGRFFAQGDATLLALAYDAGLGERNAQGFGMFRVVTPPQDE
ncbi:CRISPR-associated endoribonuclease Cas6 [Candidatus Caldatribacterium saccharofermentans]|uniref:CRISPR-associated endoribonuclease n=1 Tax=Candidatus Caldatribacterium saccharofermentans TaxID=1454753 RepID=A0A7V4TGE7_9BACT